MVVLAEGTKGTDSYGKVSGAALAAANRLFACRYVCHENAVTAGKIMRKPEYDDLEAHGVAAIFDNEWHEDRWRGGWQNGVDDALDALGFANQYGYPTPRPVIGNADQNVGGFVAGGRAGAPQDLPTAFAYFDGMLAALQRAGYRIGVYGGAWFLDALRSHWMATGVDVDQVLWWLSGALDWSRDAAGHWVIPDWVNIWQLPGSMVELGNIGGTTVDENVVRKAYDLDQTTTTGGPMEYTFTLAEADVSTPEMAGTWLASGPGVVQLSQGDPRLGLAAVELSRETGHFQNMLALAEASHRSRQAHPSGSSSPLRVRLTGTLDGTATP